MDHRERMQSSAGYGAICMLYAVLTASTESLLTTLDSDIALDRRAYRATADGMVTGLAQIAATPEWSDARSQVLALAERHRDLIDQLDFADVKAFHAATAELGEALMISRMAIGRLAVRLGLSDGDGLE